MRMSFPYGKREKDLAPSKQTKNVEISRETEDSHGARLPTFKQKTLAVSRREYRLKLLVPSSKANQEISQVMEKCSKVTVTFLRTGV
jgi:hypothetical protein